MKIIRAGVILALFFSAASLSSCVGGNKNANTQSTAAPSNRTGENPNLPKTNVEELGLLVNVPYETEDIVWKEYASQKRLLAVLRFSPADAAKLVAESEKIRSSESAAVSSETWFPAELIAKSEMSGDDNLSGRSYAANQFFQEPYSSGQLVRIENTDYFVLDLTAK